MHQLRDLDLKLMRVFVVLAEAGGFVKAQEILNYAPSTLSEQIKDLELRVGFAVCIRGSRGFRLTEQGEELYQVAKKTLESIETARNQVNHIAGRLTGALKIGVVDSISSDTSFALDEVLADFQRLHGEVSIQLSVHPMLTLESALLDADIDIAIGLFPVTSKSLDYLKLHTERQVLYCGEGNPLFGTDEKDIDDKKLQQVSYAACDYPSQTGLTLRASAAVATMEAMLLQILSGRYIGFLPEHFAEPWCASGKLWPLAPARYAYEAQFSAATRRSTIDDLALRKFLNILSQRVTT